MSIDKDEITQLFQKYLDNDISGTELKKLFGYIQGSQEEVLKEQIIRTFKEAQTEEGTNRIDWEKMFSDITTRSANLRLRKSRERRMWYWRGAAAVLLLIMGSIAVYWFNHNHQIREVQSLAGPVNKKAEVLPGGNKAVLTLSNGKEIALNDRNKGKLATQGNTNVVKQDSSMLSYEPAAAAAHSSAGVRYNVLRTPRGGQYRLKLSDGTKVWLNAFSSIRYPVVFNGNKREVEITGEVYFEVVHDKNAPFEVKVGNEIIKDLGTRFNVNAYADEPVVKTTLLEGAVKIGSIILQPGQQAVRNKEGKLRIIDQVNIENIVSWKNGFFSFDNDDLQTVMRKLSRWYNVKVIYKPGVRNHQRFSGRIDRNLTLSQVLEGLALVNAHYKINSNRKIEILP